MAKKLLSTLLCVVLVLSSVVIASAADVSTNATGDTAYATAAKALDAQYGYNGDDLGATYTPEGTTFKVWAPTATSVKLNRYATGSDAEEGAQKLGTTDLTFDETTGIWSVKVEGDLINTYYTYTVTAKNVTGAKTTTNEVPDVYSVATGVNGKRSQIVDLDKTDPKDWDKDTHVVFDRSTQQSVWEVHVKDFSYAPNSGVSDAHRGKYLAFTETGTTLNNEGNVATMVDYLKELGITTVQINPFYDFGSVNESGPDDQFNWGYDPMNYNVPEGSYSTNPYDGNVRINECKQMVQALHNAGISVVMDVVYNHTYNTNTSFEACVPNYYYKMTSTGLYSNGSGCGNETASETLMFRNFMRQSCLYWVNEYHIDGFRFDLMGLHDTETMNLIREDLDKVDPRLTMWGEGWTGGSSTYPSTTCTGEKYRQAVQASAPYLNERVGFFNDGIRDGIKGSVFGLTSAGWVQGVDASYPKVTAGVLANTKSGNWKASAPSQCVTYDSCHDNQTLWDRLAASQELEDYYRKRHPMLVAESKLTGGIITMSQGVTFMLAGEEMGRSKDGDHNSYSSSATENMIDWSLVKSNADIVSYYKGLLDIRRNFAPLTDDTKNSEANYRSLVKSSDPSSIYAGLWTNTTEGELSNLLVLGNNKGEAQQYKVPAVTDVKNWVIIANDKSAGVKNLGEVEGSEMTIPARSMLILVDKASFDSAAVNANRGNVNVKAVNALTGEVIDTYTITGTVGAGYEVAEPAIDPEFAIASVTGDMTGTFAAEDKEVILNYDLYVPQSIKDADFNGDGEVNISDATYIQYVLVGKKSFKDAAEEKAADVDYDGSVDVSDVTMIQKYLVKMSIATGTITVNHFISGTTNKIAESVTYTGRVGTTYKAETAKALGYELDTENMPKSEITVPFGDLTINFFYKEGSTDINLHVKHSGAKTWNPTFWIWGTRKGMDSTNYCTKKSWPGDTITVKDTDGWYTKSFTAETTDDSYNFIVSEANGSSVLGQSVDCTGFVQNDLWIVIDDSKDGVQLKVYSVNPDTNPEAEVIYTT